MWWSTKNTEARGLPQVQAHNKEICKASLVCIMNSKPARAMQEEPVLKVNLL